MLPLIFLTVVLEGHLQLDPVLVDLVVLDGDVLHYHLGYTEIPEALRGGLDGTARSILPGGLTASHEFDDLIDTAHSHAPFHWIE